jgi:CheY-like chemotaxis protein
VAKNDSEDVPAGKYVRIEVVDNGIGMSADVIERAADPYFTTKEKGIGTGVGLSVVRAIVDSYDSHLRISSRPDAGTRISVYIPVIDDDPAAVAPVPGAAASPLGAGQHILVVDDEPYMVEVICRLLKSLNYIPSCFDDSRKALAQFQTAPDRYPVVISDATMPQLSGIKLIQKIKAINPAVKTILFSGLDSNCKSNDSIAAADIDIFLSKPANRDVFAQALKKLLQ